MRGKGTDDIIQMTDEIDDITQMRMKETDDNTDENEGDR